MDDRPSNVGMLRKVRNYITWGGISGENVALLIRERGRLVGDQKLTDHYAKEIGYKSLDDLMGAICKSQVNYNELPKVKPVFRLHPPKKGFKGKIKKSYAADGVTGYRGDAINDLIKRMM
jgi:large subunit ribosomal protein L30